MDDHSRLVCHLQWFLDETTASLVHGVSQAIMKRGLPRAIMTDNGAAMIADEFVEGLASLGILHQTTCVATIAVSIVKYLVSQKTKAPST